MKIKYSRKELDCIRFAFLSGSQGSFQIINAHIMYSFVSSAYASGLLASIRRIHMLKFLIEDYHFSILFPL